jgi:plastocyanin
MTILIISTIFLVILIFGSSQLLVAANAQQDDFTMILNPGATNSDSQNPVSPSVNITVPSGTNVTWINKDSSPHMLVSGTPDKGPDNLFYGDFFGTSENYTVTFEKPGTYPYYDPAWSHIRGVITVESPEFSSDLESSLDNSGTVGVDDSIPVGSNTSDAFDSSSNNFNASEGSVSSFPSSSLSSFPSFTTDNTSGPSLPLSSLASDQTLANIFKKVGPLLSLLMGGTDSSLPLPSSSSLLSSSSFSQSNESSGIRDINNQSSSTSLTTQSSSSDQTLANIFKKVGPLLSLLMGGINYSNNLDENQKSTVTFNTSHNENIKSLSSAINSRGIDENQSYQLVKEWGTHGTGDGEFETAQDITVGLDKVYVSGDDRIQKFDNNGTFITKWGSTGAGDGEFSFPQGIATDSNGNVYVVDSSNNRIQKFDSNGTFITKWGSNGTDYGQFNFPTGITTDDSNNVYVADDGNNRIQKFDSNGTFITKWGSAEGTGPYFGLFSGVKKDMAVDHFGNAYVTGIWNIQKFDSNGTHILEFGTTGAGDGEFYDPQGIATDSNGNVYVADNGNYRIQKFDSNGTFITKWMSQSSLDGRFMHYGGVDIKDIAVDPAGHIYATVEVYGEGYRILVFAPSIDTSS